MASYRKRGSSWRVEVCVNGERRSMTTPTKAAAVAWAREQEALLLLPQATTVGPYTLRELGEKYVAEVSVKKKGRWWEAIRVRKIIAEIGPERLVAGVQPRDIAEWRDARLRVVKGASVQREMILLSNMFAVAVREWGWITANPCAGVKKPPASPPRDALWADSEVDAVVAALQQGGRSQVVAQVFLFALETAMRAGEILALRTVDVDIERRVVQVRQSKTGRGRTVPLTPAAVEILRGAIREGKTVFPVDSQTRDVLFRRAMRTAGVEGRTFHDARHTAITRLSRVLSPLELARVSGHADLKMLLVYYNEPAEEIAKKLV